MEHFRSDLEGVLAERKCGFAIVGGEIYVCGEVMDTFGCKECDFNPPHCVTDRMKWLMSEYKSEPVLTKRGKHFVEFVQEGWLARDEDGRLDWHENKPYKYDNVWCSDDYSVRLRLFQANDLFPFIIWKDEEPWSVEELRKLKVKE